MSNCFCLTPICPPQLTLVPFSPSLLCMLSIHFRRSAYRDRCYDSVVRPSVTFVHPTKAAGLLFGRETRVLPSNTIRQGPDSPIRNDRNAQFAATPRWYVCVLHRGSDCSLTRAMDGRIMRHGIIAHANQLPLLRLQSASGHESDSCKQRYSKYPTFTFTTVLQTHVTDCLSLEIPRTVVLMLLIFRANPIQF